MTEMKTKILQILRHTDGYVSGQQLCDELGVSRTAVWKVINQLKEEGYEIEAVRNKGYHILEAADVLDSSEIRSRLHTQWIGKEVYYQSEIDSTNSWRSVCRMGCRISERSLPPGGSPS